MKRYALMLGLLAGCYPAGKGQELEARVDKLDASSTDLSKQLAAERDDLKKQSGDLTARLDELQGRLDKLDKAAHSSDADVGVQLSAVRDDVAQLRGSIEEYQHRIDQLEQGMKALGTETDQKLAQAKGPDAVKQQSVAQQLKTLQRPSDKKEFLKLADDKASGGEAELATALYGEWLNKWPHDPLAAQAHYNLGKLQQEAHHERDALGEYGEVAKNFGKSTQAPPALLRSSECFQALNMWDAAKLALQELTKDYPASQEGHIAKEKLKKWAPGKKK